MSSNFRQSVECTRHLESSWCPGLQALRAEDKPHIVPDDPRRLKGSADVDSALKKIDPYGHRWDFAIAYDHVNRDHEVIYWTELHTASDGEVNTVIEKTRWLLEWLKNEGANLNGFERDIVWVASGATTFTNFSTQRKKMAKEGLIFGGSHLRIKEHRD